MGLADGYDCVLLDLDGVLYRGRAAVDGAGAVVDELRRRVGVAFLTNNSSRTPEDVARALVGMGIPARPEEIVTSAVATATVLARAEGHLAFVIGEDGLIRALEEVGIAIVGQEAERVDWVVVGLDRRADYAKLSRGCELIQRGARLVATNADASFPVEGGLRPGAGALLAVLTSTTGATPQIVGKPHAPLFETARARAGGGRALVVGDRLDTDIDGAASLGWDSVLVLTGVSTREDAERAERPPTYIGKDLSILLEEPGRR